MKHLDVAAPQPSQPLKQRGKLVEPANVGFASSHREQAPVVGLKFPHHLQVDGLNYPAPAIRSQLGQANIAVSGWPNRDEPQPPLHLEAGDRTAPTTFRVPAEPIDI